MIDKFTLPTTVKNGENVLKIRRECDYRIVLRVIEILNDPDFDEYEKAECSLRYFYENPSDIVDAESALSDMMQIINGGEVVKNHVKESPIMDWAHDFSKIAPPVSRVLGYDVRREECTHFWSFLGAYREIGECSFSTIISIRRKRMKGKALDKWEQEIYRENKEAIDLPMRLTPEEEEFLYSD